MRNTPNQGKRCHDSAFSEVLAFITKSKRRTFSGGAKAQRLCVPLQGRYRLASAQPSHPEPFSSTCDKTLRENCLARRNQSTLLHDTRTMSGACNQGCSASLSPFPGAASSSQLGTRLCCTILREDCRSRQSRQAQGL